ncbi:MAG: multiheme c-type cytochrome [Planctomycetota bacterium]|nr:multiheme c-type cytochrome [Planctomycetota bacterium]
MWNAKMALLAMLGLVSVGLFVAVMMRVPPAPSAPDQVAVARTSRPAGYLGSAACRECHSEIYQTYQQHPMAQSMAAVEAASEIEDYRVGTEFQRPKSRQYRVERTAEGVFHHELGLSIDGETIYDQKVPVHFAVGSGRRGRSYLTQQDGTLLVSAISWYTAEKCWDLSPGYQPGKHQRFERVATARCLECHAGRIAYQGTATTDLVQHYKSVPFVEFGIGCERCHGPGESHVARHRDDLSAVTDSIVNPAKLNPFRRDAVCNQCHLQGAGHQLRVGRRYQDFRPGDHLGDNWTLFVMGTGVGEEGGTVAISHVEQMQSSSCYRESQGKLGCASCHDPHSVPDESRRREHFNSRCARCHEQIGCALPLSERQAAPSQGSCIDCHMPRLSAADVPHTVQTDHRLLRAPHLPLAQPDESTTGDTAAAAEPRVFDGQEAPIAEWEVQRAKGLMLAEVIQAGGGKPLVDQAEQLLNAARAVRADDVEMLDALAFIRLNQGETVAAVEHWQRALELDSQRQGPLDALATYFQAQGNETEAAKYLRRLIKILPWRADLHFRYSQVLERQGQRKRALEAAQVAYRRDPSRPAVSRLLLRLHNSLGNRREADVIRRKLRQLEGR